MSAVFSSCRRWPYVLERDVSQKPGVGVVAWVGLNPSTADEGLDDATVRRCKAFTRAWGFSTYRMLNAYAWRSRDPRLLPKLLPSGEDPIGPENDAHLVSGTSDAQLIICAWGRRIDDAVAAREANVVRLLHGAGRKLHALRFTCAGHPEHPLFLPKELKPIPYGGPP
jgi:hypothetical protein